MNSANKGEWSELYAFIKLLKEGKIYAADEYVNRINNIFFPIIKIIREEINNNKYEYFTGNKIKIFEDGVLKEELDIKKLEESENILHNKIFLGTKNTSKKGAFEIPEIDAYMNDLHITKIKAPSKEKIDMTMQIHDINTGYTPTVGFSVKSDLGQPPTLLNAGRNTRIKYKIEGINDQQMEEINAIDKAVDKHYIKRRMNKLFSYAKNVIFNSIRDETFNENLILIDSLLPQIYGEMLLYHFKYIDKGISDCEVLAELLKEFNPIKYKRNDIYRYKIKKLICAAALGMTPGSEWNGLDAATGGYIIIKKDGDVLCYHLYNRNYFEEYLLRNTMFDRPSASRHDYGYVYKENNNFYIDFNVQIRFKSIKAGNKDKENILEIVKKVLEE